MEKKSRISKLIVSAFLFVFIALGVVWKIGPDYGVFILPPSPADYGSYVLDKFEQGLQSGTGEWLSKKGIFRQELKTAQTYDEADEILKKAAAVAGGKESRLVTRDELGMARYNFIKPEISLMGDILLIKLPSFLGNSEQSEIYVRTVAEALGKQNYKGIILDITSLSGGDPGTVLSSAAPLFKEGEVLTYVYRGGHRQEVKLEKGHLTGVLGVVKTEATAKKGVPIAIVTGNETKGTGEQLLLAFSGMEMVRTFGQSTAGYLTVMNNIPLLSGNMIELTVGMTEDKRGIVYGNTSLEPQEKTDPSEAVKKAKEWLNIEMEHILGN